MARSRNERGQASLLALTGIVIAVLATALVARVTVAAVQQARAQHAADAAALAGVSGGATLAAAIAADNGAELVSFEGGDGRSGGSRRVTVVVRWGDRTARATAEGDPERRRGPPPTAGWHPLAPVGALRSVRCPMATSVRRPPHPRDHPRRRASMSRAPVPRCPAIRCCSLRLVRAVGAAARRCSAPTARPRSRPPPSPCRPTATATEPTRPPAMGAPTERAASAEPRAHRQRPPRPIRRRRPRRCRVRRTGLRPGLDGR